MVLLPADRWSNVVGSAEEQCRCGSWKEHWLNYSKQAWPGNCSVLGCSRPPRMAANVYNAGVDGQYITPMCETCNKSKETFSLTGKLINAEACC